MSLIWGLLALLAAAVAATCGVRAARRALAGGLIGEISETLTLLETHDLEAALAHCGEGGRGAEPSGAADAQLSRRRRLDGAARRSSGAAVGELLRVGPGAAGRIARPVERNRRGGADGARQVRVQELQRTFALGDETLRSLRDVVSRRRCGSISRS